MVHVKCRAILVCRSESGFCDGEWASKDQRLKDLVRFWASGLSQEKVEVMKGNHHHGGAGVMKKKKKRTHIKGVFSVNNAKFELYLRYRNCWKLFRILRKKSEFWYHHFRNSTKNMREKKKNGGDRKCWISKMYRNSSAQFLLTSCEVCVECPKWKDKKNLWQTNCGNTITEIGEKNFVTIVAMALPKMGGKKCGSEI